MGDRQRERSAVRPAVRPAVRACAGHVAADGAVCFDGCGILLAPNRGCGLECMTAADISWRSTSCVSRRADRARSAASWCASPPERFAFEGLEHLAALRRERVTMDMAEPT
jgi:hypothetical protein